VAEHGYVVPEAARSGKRTELFEIIR
jgi:hypothetical protein